MVAQRGQICSDTCNKVTFHANNKKDPLVCYLN